MGNPVIRAAVIPALFLAASAVTAQDRPDFTGAWGTYRGNPNAAGAAAPPAGQLQLKPDAQAAVDAYRSLIEGTNFSPGNACVGYGMPESMMSSGGYPMEIIQHPEQVLIVYEMHNELRRIYLDGEAQDPATFFPERNGYSTAHWEGERLVVETTRLKSQVDTRDPLIKSSASLRGPETLRCKAQSAAHSDTIRKVCNTAAWRFRPRPPGPSGSTRYFVVTVYPL
jgi:hypothetical protein